MIRHSFLTRAVVPGQVTTRPVVTRYRSPTGDIVTPGDVIRESVVTARSCCCCSSCHAMIEGHVVMKVMPEPQLLRGTGRTHHHAPASHVEVVLERRGRRRRRGKVRREGGVDRKVRRGNQVVTQMHESRVMVEHVVQDPVGTRGIRPGGVRGPTGVRVGVGMGVGRLVQRLGRARSSSTVGVAICKRMRVIYYD